MVSRFHFIHIFVNLSVTLSVGWYRNDKGEGGKGRFLLCGLSGEKTRCFGKVKGEEGRDLCSHRVRCVIVCFVCFQVSSEGGESPHAPPGSRCSWIPGERGSTLQFSHSEDLLFKDVALTLLHVSSCPERSAHRLWAAPASSKWSTKRRTPSIKWPSRWTSRTRWVQLETFMLMSSKSSHTWDQRS